MARLDRLAPAKEVAQVGAVIGREFGHRLIAEVLSDRRRRPTRHRAGALLVPNWCSAAARRPSDLQLQARAGARHGLQQHARASAAFATLRSRRASNGCTRTALPSTRSPRRALVRRRGLGQGRGLADAAPASEPPRPPAFEEAATLFDRALQANAHLDNGKRRAQGPTAAALQTARRAAPALSVCAASRRPGAGRVARGRRGRPRSPGSGGRATSPTFCGLRAATTTGPSTTRCAVSSLLEERAARTSRSQASSTSVRSRTPEVTTRLRSRPSGLNIERLRSDASAPRYNRFLRRGQWQLVGVAAERAWPLRRGGHHAYQVLEAAQASGDTMLMLAALHGFTYLHCLRGEFDRAVEAVIGRWRFQGCATTRCFNGRPPLGGRWPARSSAWGRSSAAHA